MRVRSSALDLSVAPLLSLNGHTRPLAAVKGRTRPLAGLPPSLSSAPFQFQHRTRRQPETRSILRCSPHAAHYTRKPVASVSMAFSRL
eukprot:558840-Rhodomonas_salina.1